MSAPITEAHLDFWKKLYDEAFVERHQLRSDRNNLRIDLDAIKAILNEQKDRAERAEAEVERLGHLEAVLRSSAADMTAGSITAGGVADLRAENERLRRAYVRPDDIRAQLESANARAERAEASLHALRLVCGTTDADKFTTWFDRANARAEKAETELATERARMSELKAKGCEALIIATTWAHVWGDKLSPDSLRDFKKHEAAFLADAAMKEDAK